MPRFAPATLVQVREPFDHPEFVFELKLDGFRALAFLENGAVSLVSRKGNAYKAFGDLRAHLSKSIAATSAVLDGEIVCLGPDGRPQFYDLMRRRTPQCFYAFDILWLNGRDLRDLSLLSRKDALRRVVPTNAAHLRYTEHLESGTELFRAVCAMDLEGIVAKHKDAPYGIERSWIKIKNPDYSQAEGRRELFEGRKPPMSEGRGSQLNPKMVVGIAPQKSD